MYCRTLTDDELERLAYVGQDPTAVVELVRRAMAEGFLDMKDEIPKLYKEIASLTANVEDLRNEAMDSREEIADLHGQLLT